MIEKLIIIYIQLIINVYLYKSNQDLVSHLSWS